MKATEFAEYFEFTIQKGEEPDEFGEISKYDVVDNQGVFHTRHIDDVKDLVDCFDSMLDDYVFDTLEEDGFEVEGFDENTIKFAEEKYGKDSGFTEMIKAFVNPDLIEDDVYEKELIKCG
jgi:hypothetical protein